MCGINGFNFKDENLINQMMSLTSQRGPDGSKTYIDGKISISHNRLSIVDLSKRSDQPFEYENLVLSFNGEIFNYKNLKKDLISKGYKFQTTSDTEVLIKLFHFHGINAFKKISGIFAISIWDKKKEELYVIRDILGVKPLYYHHNQSHNKFYFSSSINSLLKCLEKKEINIEACNRYMNFWYNDFDETFYKNVFKVKPGQLLILKKNNLVKKNYLEFSFERKNFDISNLEKIINKQFISDVPVALSLSGGVDSNLILNFLNKKVDKFKTYSIRFKNYEKSNQDADIAKKITEYYKIENEQIEVSSFDLFENLEKIVKILEEPIGNQTSVLNFILSNRVKEKVLFTGDGGDEIFSGYNKYRSILMFSAISKFNIFNFFKGHPIKNLRRCSFKSSHEFYLSFSEQNLMDNQELYFKAFDKVKSNNLNFNYSENYKNLNLNNVMFHDIEKWIQHDALMRNDKIFMNKGIEVRVPFLDQEMIEKFLFLNQYTKIGFLNNIKPYIQNNFKNGLKHVTRKKRGFLSPFSSWIKEDLNNYSKEILSKSYYNSNLLNYDNIEKLIDGYKKETNNSYLILTLMKLQIFLRQNNF